MKTVKFWEAMKARSEGKDVRYIDGPDLPSWISPTTKIPDHYSLGEYAGLAWQIRQEPREWKLAFHDNGSVEVVSGDTYVFLYSGKPPKIVRVREVIE